MSQFSSRLRLEGLFAPRRALSFNQLGQFEKLLRETDMAKGQQKGNREAKKPKKEKIKVIAAAPSRKNAGWQPDFGPAKRK